MTNLSELKSLKSDNSMVTVNLHNSFKLFYLKFISPSELNPFLQENISFSPNAEQKGHFCHPNGFFFKYEKKVWTERPQKCLLHCTEDHHKNFTGMIVSYVPCVCVCSGNEQDFRSDMKLKKNIIWIRNTKNC